jgi:hypothetical protein
MATQVIGDIVYKGLPLTGIFFNITRIFGNQAGWRGYIEAYPSQAVYESESRDSNKLTEFNINFPYVSGEDPFIGAVAALISYEGMTNASVVE